MPDQLLEQARIYLRNQGAPISKYNLDQAKRELTDDPKLRPDYDGNSQMLSNVGYSDRPDGSKEMSPLRPNSGSAAGKDQFFTADSQFGSNPLADQGKAKAARAKASEMANADRKSGVMFKGGQGATPGTTSSSVSTESVDNTTHDTAPIPDVTSSELNQLAPRRRPPAAQGARPGPAETNASRPHPASLEGGTLHAPELPPVDTNWHMPPASTPVASAGAGINPAAAADNGSGVPPSAQVEPSPSWGDMYNTLTGWMPPGTGDRAKNVLGYGAAIGGPLLAAFAGLRGGAKGPLTSSTMRPPTAGVAGTPPPPFPPSPYGPGSAPPVPGAGTTTMTVGGGPPVTSTAPPSSGITLGRPEWLAERARIAGLGTPSPAAPTSPAAMPEVMNPVTAAAPPPGLARVFNPQPPQAPMNLPPTPANLTPVASPTNLGDVLLSAKGPVGMRTVHPAGPVPGAPPIGQGVPAIPGSPPIPRVPSEFFANVAPRAAPSGVGRAGTARLPPTPGKGMTLEDARGTSGGGAQQPKPTPKKSGRTRARAKGNQK